MKIHLSFLAKLHKAPARAWRSLFIAWLTFVGLALNGATMAQAPQAETVTWSVAPASDNALRADSRLALTVHGAVREGWHVYSLKQAADGPTPLLVSLGTNSVARADGRVTESQPNKVQDAAFGFVTQFFDKDFTLTAPVRLKPGLKPGAQTIPVNVRFQTCNGATCQPPKTVHLSAAITIQAVR